MTTPSETTAEQRWRELPAPWPAAFEWIGRTVGGEVISAARQARWRPSWFVDVRMFDGTVRALYLRCQREEDLPWTQKLSIEREYRIMLVLQDHGINIPEVLGFCPEPEGILMEAVSGRDRFGPDDSPLVRDQVLDEYIQELARAHAIDPAAFAAAGLHRPVGEREIGMMGFELSEKWYRSVKPGPDPVNEFIVRWLHRNVPAARDRVSWIHFDAGQFLHAGGHVTALMDVEFACLGDPLADLGAMRMRDTAQPIGDLMRAYATYEHATGEPVVPAVVNFHAVRFASLTALLSVGVRRDPPPEFDLAQWESWALLSQVLCLEIIAEQAGVELDAEESLPEPAASRRRPWMVSAERVLSDIIDGLPEDDHLAFRLRIARDMDRAVLRADEVAAAMEERDRADEERLLGLRPVDWQEADRLIEELVLTAGPERDTELVRFLHRRVRRQQVVLDPAMRDVRDFTVQRLCWSGLGHGAECDR
ncbi:phosphotransferase [Nocardia sp. NPDC057663]|uniref:phosphotransferase n=1 Tax=Nocardia sp. NPDC057663 TaxID=3346201 RepID=UPI00366C9FD1